MKPVNKGLAPQVYASYEAAKPDLLERLGAHCSYCEAYGVPQDLHVEHIYPKDPHPERERSWDNFLVSCVTCNSYKNIHLGTRRRRGLEKRYVWPHRENTFRAFQYFSDGRVELRPRLRQRIKKASNATREMVGLMMSPAKAAAYKKRGIAYDGVEKRKEQWAQAEGFRNLYLENPSQAKARMIADCAKNMGYFSIWMEVFAPRPEVRSELIRAFKADSACFDANGHPIRKGRL